MGQFSVDIAKFIGRYSKNKELVTRKIVLDVGSRIVEKTPVGDPSTWKNPPPKGYVGGRARGSWTYGFGSVPSPVDAVDSSGQASLERISAGVASNAAMLGPHYIINALPYIKRLEFDSWSKQAPAGMVRTTIAEYQQIVDKAAAEVRRETR